MKINKRHFFIDTFSNGIYFGSKFLGSLVIYSILINSYNLDTYGVYIFFASLLAQLEFMQAGFSTSLLRFLPIYGNNTIKMSNLIAVVSLSYLGIGILVSIALIALSYTQLFAYLAFSGWENYVKILIIVAPIFWFFKSFSFALRGVKDFRFDNLINLFFLVLEILVIWILSESSKSLETIFAIVFLIAIVKHFTHFLILKIRHGLKISAIKGTLIKDEFQQIKRFSFWNFVSALSGTALNQFDKVFVSFLLGPAALTIYYGVNQFIKFYISVVGVINSSVLPYFSEKVSLSDSLTFNKTAIKGTIITSSIGLLFAGLLVLNSEFIFIFISKEYLIEYLTIFNIGIILYSFIGSRSFVNKLYVSNLNLSKSLSVFGIVTSFIYVFLIWPTTKFFGISGALLSPVLSHLIVFPFWVNFFFRKTELGVYEFFSGIVKNGFPILLLIGVFYLINQKFIKEKTFSTFLFETTIIFGVYIFIDLFKSNSLLKILLKNLRRC